MKKRILIYGAGAIGRGYVPWLFDTQKYNISYVEKNKELRELMNKNKSYKSYKIKNNKYESRVFDFEKCFAFGQEDIQDYDGIITAVGPRQVFSIVKSIEKANVPVILFENDSSLPKKLKSLTGKNNFYFGVPDVITSNTAPERKLKKDPLSLITEEGNCFAEEGAFELGGEIDYVSEIELKKQWLSKLYIHNTPHCIAAYLSHLNNKQFLHEGMANKEIFNLVKNAMMEMSKTIVNLFKIEKDFVDWYSEKELLRFSNKLLFDPVSRVAREPFRKLGLEDRLIGAAQLSLMNGIKPNAIIKGILASFLYDEKGDKDNHINILLNSLTKRQFLKVIIQLQEHEALFKLMIKEWNESLKFLELIINEK